ncbi:MAG: DegT/DnrJ/EryC1/StrS family aminotransferase [Candidatus Gracilibacteria bacterium]
MIPVNKPIISKEAKENVQEAIESGWISSAGKYVDRFEKAFAEYLSIQNAIAVCNGTAALHVALATLKIGPSDEVIVPAFTMGSTWLSVMYTGAKPVFVDCEADTLNIDPLLIEQKITKKTKAILPVHIYGHPSDMDPILEIAKNHNLFVVEDAAEAHGAEYKGRKCGTMGDIGIFSFYANKIISTGEGGMVVTNNNELAERARKLKDLFHSSKKRFIHEEIGFNYRMTNLQAAIGSGEILHINEYIEKKIVMAETYETLLRNIPGLITPVTKSYAKNVFWMYGIRIIPEIFGMTKDELRDFLLKNNVDTRDFFYPPNVQDVLLKTETILPNEKYPESQKAASTGLYLPSGLTITNDEIEFVCQQISKAREQAAIRLATNQELFVL